MSQNGERWVILSVVGLEDENKLMVADEMMEDLSISDVECWFSTRYVWEKLPRKPWKMFLRHGDVRVELDKYVLSRIPSGCVIELSSCYRPPVSLDMKCGKVLPEKLKFLADERHETLASWLDFLETPQDNVTELSLALNELGDEDLGQLSRLPTLFPNLTAIELDGNDLTASANACLMDMMERLPNLRWLSVYLNEDLLAMANLPWFEELHRKTLLDKLIFLPYEELKESNTPQILGRLPSSCVELVRQTHREYYKNRNHATPNDCFCEIETTTTRTSIGEFMRTTNGSQVTKLIFRKIAVEDCAIPALLQIPKKFPKLKILGLSGNNFTSESNAAIVRLLIAKPDLIVDICDTEIGSLTNVALFRKLEKRKLLGRVFFLTRELIDLPELSARCPFSADELPSILAKHRAFYSGQEYFPENESSSSSSDDDHW